MRDVLSIQRESGNGTKKYSEKRHLQINKRKRKKKKTRVAIGAPAYRRTIERRAAASTKAKIETKTKQSKTNVTLEEDVMTSANQTPGGYKFAPLVTRQQQRRANQHESACFGLSSSWSFPSRSGIRLHAVVQPWLSLQRSILP